MNIPRYYVDEYGNKLPMAPVKEHDMPAPEKNVLNARFSLTRLPVLSDNDVIKGASARKKRKNKMGNVNVAVENDGDDESTGKRGRAKAFPMDLTAQGVTVTTEELTKDQKNDAGDVIKTHKVTANVIAVSDLNGALGLFGADEVKLWEFLSEAATAYEQRTARQRLNALAQGPEKNMERAIKALVGGGFSEDKAREIVTAQFKAEGLI
jgi:hypothetical protein